MQMVGAALGSPSLPPAEAEEQVPPCRSLPEALLVPTRPFKKVDVKFTCRDRNRVEEKIQAHLVHFHGYAPPVSQILKCSHHPRRKLCPR